MKDLVMNLDDILYLPQRYLYLTNAMDECQKDLPAAFADRFLLACNDRRLIICRAADHDMLPMLDELGLAPGLLCGEWAEGQRPDGLATWSLAGGFRAWGKRMAYPDDVYLWVGGPAGSDRESGNEPDDPVVHLLYHYISLKVRHAQETIERRTFQSERAKLETFYELTSEMSAAVTPVEMMETLTRVITETMEADTTIVYQHNHCMTRLIPLVGYKIPPEELRSVHHEVEIGRTRMSDVYTVGVGKRIDDVSRQSSADGIPALSALGLRSVLLVPLRLHERPMGVMVVGRFAVRPFDVYQVEVLAFMAHQISLMLENARLRDSLALRLQALDRDLELARGMQTLMLPQGPLKAQGIEVTGSTRAARQLSGDYLDYFTSQDHLHVVVADIVGKGISAALLMAILRSHFRNTFHDQPGLSELAANQLSALIFRDFKPHRAFAAVTILSIHLQTRQVSLFLAGHPPPLLYRDGEIHQLSPIGFPALGLFDRTITRDHFYRGQLLPGDRLLLYTDGVTDAIGERAERFGEGRLQQAFRTACENAAPGDVVADVRREMEAFAVEQPDDITLCVLQVGAVLQPGEGSEC